MKAILQTGLLIVSASFLSVSAASARFEPVVIDAEVFIGYGVATGDVDGDGREDIVLMDKNQLVWYRSPDWSKHVIATDLTERDHVCLAVRDIDGDGKVEIAGGAGWNPGDTENSGSVHYFRAPADRTERWSVVDLHREPTVHRMRWVLDAKGDSELVVVPLHGRGNRGGAGAGVRVLAYRSTDESRNSWTTSEVSTDLHMTHNIDPVQWDADPEEEMLICGREGIFLLDRSGDGWSQTKLGGNAGDSGDFIGASEVRLGAGPSSRYIATIEPFHGNQVVVYSPGAGGTFWKRSVIDESLKGGHAVATGDLLGKGSDQLVVGWRDRNDEGKVGIKLYEPNEDGTWRQSLIDDNQMACEDVRVADLDKDGRLDLIASGRSTHNLIVYFNRPAGD